MAINQEHPKYPEYIEKCKALRDDLVKRESKIKLGPHSGQDNPVTFALHKDYREKLKELEKEYHFLFRPD